MESNISKFELRLDKFSHSSKDASGLHGDYSTWKLIQCVQGKFCLVVADNREDSKTLENGIFNAPLKTEIKSLYHPAVVTDILFYLTVVFHYKLAFDGEYNDVDKQFVIKWNDPKWNIECHTTTNTLQQDR